MIFRELKYSNIKKFEKEISKWVESFLDKEEELSLDGKTLRGLRKKGGKFTDLLSAFSGRLGITLYQILVEKKTNEIGMIIELLSGIILEGRILTMDALLTQRKIAKKIISENTDYVMIAKDNQKKLKEEIEYVFWAKELWTPPHTETFKKIEKGHDRSEKIKITVTEPEIVNWAGVKQIFRIEREITKKGKTSLEVVYGLTGLPKEKAEPKRLLKLNRNHWSIENKSHWVRDVTFDEDRIQIKNDNIAQLMALVRNISIGIIRFDGYNNIAEAIRHYAANPFNTLALIMLKIK